VGGRQKGSLWIRERGIRVGGINAGVRGILNEVDIWKLRSILKERGIGILGVVEHWRGEEERMRRYLGVKETEEEKREKEQLCGEEYIWVERCRRKGRRGGVGLVVLRELGRVEVLEDFCDESVMWVRITSGMGQVMYVGVVYLVTAGTVFSEDNMSSMSKLAVTLSMLEGEENVVILGDVNGRIGQIGSKIKVGEEVREIQRESEDMVVSEQGKDMLEMLQEFGMVVINGVGGGSSGKMTCRGKSVVDWMVVKEEMRDRCSTMVVEDGFMEEGGRADGDHNLVMFDWLGGREWGIEEKGEQEKGVEGNGGCNISRGWRDNWMDMKRVSDIVMREWCDREDRGGGIEEVMKSWRESYERVITDSVGWKKKEKGKKKTNWYDKDISRLRREMEEVMREWMSETDEVKKGELGERRKEMRRVRQKEVRIERNRVRMKKMREIEEDGRQGRREGLLRKLEDWGGKKRAVMGGDRERMRDEKGVWYGGEELRLKWKETFEKVGVELERKQGFDEEWKEEVEREVDRWEEEGGVGWMGVDEEIGIQEEGKEEKVSLDMDVARWEVRRALKKIKSGKACGEDRVITEILKYGGEWMEKSVWELCVLVFREEKVPVEWLRAVKVPVRKKGIGDRFDEYRGVTLLSVLGKVFGMVMEARIRLFCEEKGVLSDSQFGFRKGRACRDPLFVLSEVIQRRGKGRVFAGFLDITKAYPSVWRKGMWFKLWKVGIRGRMWRVLRTLYSKCDVAVRVGGETKEWYEEFVGVREGCVLSPLLFAIFINDLAEEIEKGGGGVKVGGVVVRCMMFADDVVLLADTAEGLQSSLERAWGFSQKWRFDYNFGVDKSAVVVFGGVREGEKWVLGDIHMEVVKDYKYLGVRFDEKGKWGVRREELIGKAKGGFWRAWGLGMGGGELSGGAAAGLWETLVRPVLEYGSEIDSGKWEDAEVLQRKAGRRCLGVGNSVANEVVMGDLGWWSMRARREYLRLVYWGKVVKDRVDGMVGGIYREGRKRIEEGRAGKGEWCVETKRLLEEIGLGEWWITEEVESIERWRGVVYRMMHAQEERRWKMSMIGRGEGREGKVKVKLARYNRIKSELKREWFLSESRVWVSRWVKLRAGVEGLEVERGRHRRIDNKRMERWERICKLCDCGNVEDEEHFLDECGRWESERKEMWAKVASVDLRVGGVVGGWGREERVDWMMKGGNTGTALVLLREVSKMLFKREKEGGVVKGKQRERGIKKEGAGRAKDNKCCSSPEKIGDTQYEVEGIVDRRVSALGEEFLLKWKGYGESSNSWQLKSEIDAPQLLREFRLRSGKAARAGGVER
jgi:hypothetical protein